MNKQAFDSITRYFGFVTVAVSWVSLITAAMTQSPNWSEPISQFGTYDATKVLFGSTITLTALTWYLFSRHLNAYWKYTSRFTLFASIAFTTVGWVPYQPYAKTFILDAHNIAVITAAFCYALPLWFIGYTKAHAKIAQIAHLLCVAILVLIAVSFISRLTNTGVIYTQTLVLVPAQIWLIIANTLLLQTSQTKSIAPIATAHRASKL